MTGLLNSKPLPDRLADGFRTEAASALRQAAFNVPRVFKGQPGIQQAVNELNRLAGIIDSAGQADHPAPPVAAEPETALSLGDLAMTYVRKLALRLWHDVEFYAAAVGAEAANKAKMFTATANLLEGKPIEPALEDKARWFGAQRLRLIADELKRDEGVGSLATTAFEELIVLADVVQNPPASAAAPALPPTSPADSQDGAKPK